MGNLLFHHITDSMFNTTTFKKKKKYPQWCAMLVYLKIKDHWGDPVGRWSLGKADFGNLYLPDC